MLVRFKNTFFWKGRRFRSLPDGVQVPAEAFSQLPSRCLVWDNGKWAKPKDLKGPPLPPIAEADLFSDLDDDLDEEMAEIAKEEEQKAKPAKK